MRRLTLLLLLFSGGCGGDDDGTAAGTDAGGSGGDAGSAIECDPTAQPAAMSDCIPDPCGNEIGVGMTCTEGGGECNDNGFTNAWLCTHDHDPTASLNICTKPCVVDEDCGTGAVCTGDPDDPDSGRGCVPAPCAD